MSGRVRLRAPGVHGDAARAAEVAATVRALDGVTSAQANPRTGTLLVHFDPDQTSVRTIVAALAMPVPVRVLRLRVCRTCASSSGRPRVPEPRQGLAVVSDRYCLAAAHCPVVRSWWQALPDAAELNCSQARSPPPRPNTRWMR